MGNIKGYMGAAWIALAAISPVPAQPALPSKVPYAPWNGTDQDNLHRPVWFGSYPGLPGSFALVQQRMANGSDQGAILLYEYGAAIAKKTFLQLKVDISHNEMGLLGLAFHPGFTANRRYFISYTPPKDASGLSLVVEERRASEDFRKDSGSPGKLILKVPLPGTSHHAGELQFGPGDGLLYIGLGDGEWNLDNPDPFRNGQNLESLLAKVLRIDVDGASEGRPYGIPPGNPYASTGGKVRPEIWAHGLRNPWRFSFDPAPPHDLWVGDVGEGSSEEVNRVKGGGNYGWPVMEGSRCAPRGGSRPATCANAGMLPPLLSLNRADRHNAQSIIGGAVFRGSPSSAFDGAYLFGDYLSDHLFGLRARGDSLVEWKDFGAGPGSTVSFGKDAQGNLYFIAWRGNSSGVVYRLDLGTPMETTQPEGPVRSAFHGLAARSDGTRLRIEALLPGAQSIALLALDGKVVAERRVHGPCAFSLTEDALPARGVLVWRRKGLTFRKTLGSLPQAR